MFNSITLAIFKLIMATWATVAVAMLWHNGAFMESIMPALIAGVLWYYTHEQIGKAYQARKINRMSADELIAEMERHAS